MGHPTHIELISHASVVIHCDGTGIWTDPWLFGSAFNNSWELLGATAPPADLDQIQFLWISHEHPDHFHIPTLRSLPQSFKDRVTVLFQSLNSNKVFDAFAKMGFANHLALPSRRLLSLPGSSCIAYCYPVGQMDSVLGVSNAGVAVLDINDAELDAQDCKIIRKDFGVPDVVLSQFSYAGYAGLPHPEIRLTKMAARSLEKVSAYHRDLGASVSIPIANFVYFSRQDNCYMNNHVNRPSDVARYMEPRGQHVVVLAPGDTWIVGSSHDSASASAHWDKEYDAVGDMAFAPSDATSLDELETSFHERVLDLRKKYPKVILRMLKPVTIQISDLDVRVELCFGSDTFSVLRADDGAAEVEMNSQPLWFLLSQPFGMQTTGTSGRYGLTSSRSFRRWRRYRILFALDNAELYLRPARLLGRSNLEFARTRLTILPRQIAYQLRRMR